MKIHNETVTLPAYWASALINGDYSGLFGKEHKAVETWITDNPQYAGCLTCSEYPELKIFDGLLTECLEYTFPVNFYRTTDSGINYIVYPAQTKQNMLPRHKIGYASCGYGEKIPSATMVLLCGIWRRVYYTCYSNVATCWINFQGKRVIVDSLFKAV